MAIWRERQVGVIKVVDVSTWTFYFLYEYIGSFSVSGRRLGMERLNPNFRTIQP